MHQLKRGRMNRIPAKISEEIRVLFEYKNIDPGASEQDGGYDARRTATGDTAGCGSPFQAHNTALVKGGFALSENLFENTGKA